ncbi:MAG: hypothetical protein LUF92_06875 [Clostridiales bacterium]|nr:hypothetical protein [Clostridiales bacterium]
MFTIAIGEDSEYGQRLRKYLEAHWSEPLRIFSFTSPETLLECKDDVDCYLLGESFYAKLTEAGEGNGFPAFQDRTILLSDTEGGDEEDDAADDVNRFCRYHAPIELLDMLRGMKHVTGILSDKGRNLYTVTAVYSPIYDSELKRIASQFMKQGDLYLGMEDVGNFDRNNGHMGDLCYYIGLGDEDIFARVKESAREEDGVLFVDSPDLYYDLLEISVEEYRQFFCELKEGECCRNIYVGLGSGVLAHIYPHAVFDHFILIDSKENQRLQAACDYFERTVQSGVKLFTAHFERRYREDILYEAVQ